MKINSKLFLSFSIMAVLLAIAGYISNSQVTKVADSFDVVKNEATPTIIALGNIKSDFNQLHAAVLAFNLHVPDAATNPEIKERALDHLEEIELSKANLLSSYAKYSVLEKDKDSAEKIGEGINGIIAHINEMTIIGTDIMNGGTGTTPTTGGHSHGNAAAGTTAEQTPVLRLHNMVLELDEAAMVFGEELDAKIEQNYASLAMTEATVLTDIEASISQNVMLSIAAVSIVFIVGGFAAYSITRRVRQLKIEANQVASGNLNEEITTPGSDEIAELATDFEHMRKSLVSVQHELANKNKTLQTLNGDLLVANQELRKLDKLKDQFIGIASHELRGPIHPILGYASMAKSGKIQPQVALDVIHKQALKLKQLASDILDVSRIESETLSYNMQKVKIHELLLNSLIATSGLLNPNDVSIVTKIDEAHKNLEISADKDRMGQVFTNLLNNAVKFTRKGSITAKTRVDKNANTIEIMISDTGGGIPEDIMPKLFGKFVSKNIGDTNKEGTGLGLFISKAIVTAHGGTIEAYNDNGGATFKISLPIEGAQPKDPSMVAQLIKRGA